MMTMTTETAYLDPSIARGYSLDLLADQETAWSYFADLLAACKAGYTPTFRPARWQHQELARELACHGVAVWWQG